VDYLIRIEVPEGEVKKTLDELTQAQATICRCYHKLKELGVLHITEKATSDKLMTSSEEQSS